MTFRCGPLLDLARGAPCCVTIPGVCLRHPETVVAAHSNQHDHGHSLGQKAADCYIAFACHACHDVIDARAGSYSLAQRREFWRIGFERTVLYLWSMGLVGVIKPAQRVSRSSPPMRTKPRKKESPTSRPSKMLPRRL